MKITTVKKGERISPLMIAGQDFELWRTGDIEATIFKVRGELWCPLISSKKPGGGGLPAALDEMAAEAALRNKRLVFINVINRGLSRHLKAKGIAKRKVAPPRG